MYDIMCDIESFETPLDDKEPLPDRVDIASSIVTIVGNAFAIEED